MDLVRYFTAYQEANELYKFILRYFDINDALESQIIEIIKMILLVKDPNNNVFTTII